MKPPASWRQMAYLCPEEQRGDDRSSPRGRLSCAICPPLLTWVAQFEGKALVLRALVGQQI
jgi:hypothetical protein